MVTKRNFHPGDFIRSADAGGERVPLLAVERIDVMRVVVQVPERDVPFVDLGDPAVVEAFRACGRDVCAIRQRGLGDSVVRALSRRENELPSSVRD